MSIVMGFLVGTVLTTTYLLWPVLKGAIGWILLSMLIIGAGLTGWI